MFKEFKNSGKQRFSIKKYTFGVSSVLLGTFFAISGNTAQAEENLNVSVSSSVQAADQDVAGSIIDFDSSYKKENLIIGDVEPAKASVKAEDLKYVLKKEINLPETEVEKKEIKAQTEYVSDETKDYGTKVEERKAKNGQVTTTKKYELEREVPKEVKDWPILDVEYKRDNSKELPSDRIGLLENKDLRFDSSNYKSNAEMVDLLLKIGGYIEDEAKTPRGIEIIFPKLSSGRYVDEFISNDTLSSQDEVERYYTNHEISDGVYAISKLEVESIKKVFEEKDAELRKEYEGRLWYDDVTGKWMIPWSGKAGTALVFAKSFEEIKESVIKKLETISINYNNSRGYLGVNIDHIKSGLSDAERKEFDEKVIGLPVELFKNINTLTLTEEELNNSSNTGLSLGDRREIQIRTNLQTGKFDSSKFQGEEFEGATQNIIVEDTDGNQTTKTVVAKGHKRSMQSIMKTLFHELGHNIDSMAGNLSYDNTSLEGTFSATNEFKKLYKEIFDGKVIIPYYRNNLVEAFAESFAHYVMSRLEKENPSLYAGLYKQKGYIQRKVFDKYTQNEGIIDIIKGEYINVEKGGKFEKVSSDKFKDEAYYPFEKTFPYFDDLFAKLGLWSKTPIGYKVVEKEETTSKPAENGRIILGTKPKVEDVILLYTTKTIEDNTLEVGVRKILQAGKSGLKQIITKYTLKDKLTGKLEANISENLVSSAIDEIIVIGTKLKQEPKGENKPDAEEPKGDTKPKVELEIPRFKAPEAPKDENKPDTEEPKGDTKPKTELEIPRFKAPEAPKTGNAEGKTLPKTSASKESTNNPLPAGLASILLAAGLLVRRKDK